MRKKGRRGKRGRKWEKEEENNKKRGRKREKIGRKWEKRERHEEGKEEKRKKRFLKRYVSNLSKLAMVEKKKKIIRSINYGWYPKILVVKVRSSEDFFFLFCDGKRKEKNILLQEREKKNERKD